MPLIEGHSTVPILLIHGGAGNATIEEFKRPEKLKALETICDATWKRLQAKSSALDAVQFALEALESHPLFNAGYGSTLHIDGLVRVAASVMNGETGSFSGVACATHLNHPSKLALALQSRSDRVLGPLGSQLLARELGIPPQDPVTPEQAKRWAALAQEKSTEPEHGTVGVVVVDYLGKLAAGTSTGGRGTAYPDRVSDVCTVAGNYASRSAAISCTGIGENIVDDALAARIETRVRDGQTLHQASRRCLQEALSAAHSYGWIGIDKQGNWGLYYTTQGMSAVIYSAQHSSPAVLNRDVFASESPAESR